MQHQGISVPFIRGLLLLSLAVGYIINVFFHESLTFLLIAFVILIFFVSWPGMAPLPRIISILMMIVGHFLFFLHGGTKAYWIESLLNNVGLIALFVSVPLLAYPLQNGGYIGYINKIIGQFMKKDMQVIALVVALTGITSSFINLGSVRIIFDLFFQRLGKMKKIFVKSMIQGFSLAALWSPYFAGVAIILHLVGVRFNSFVGYGLMMAVLCFSISVALISLDLRKEKQQKAYQEMAAASEAEQTATEKEPISYRKGLELLIVFAGLFLSLIFLEKWLHFNVVLLIALIAFTYPIIWSLFIKKIKAFAHSLKDYVFNVVPNIHNESVMIIAATFFTQMVQLTSFPDLLSKMFLQISQLSVVLVVAIILVVSLSVSFFTHQVLPIFVFATSLSPEVVGLKPELFALTLILCWGIQPLLSPIAATNLLVGSIFRTKTFEITQWNVKYVLTVILVASFAISVMNSF